MHSGLTPNPAVHRTRARAARAGDRERYASQCGRPTMLNRSVLMVWPYCWLNWGNMMKVISSSMALALGLSLIAGNSMAAPEEGGASGGGWSPFQFSIYNPIQLVGESKDITGLRLSLLYGKNVDVSGIDLALGATNSNNLTGIQMTGFVNWAASVKGIQIGGVGNEVISLAGVQISVFVNDVQSDVTGIQIAPINTVKGEMKGIQIGVLNSILAPKSSSVTGVQIGLFNFAGNVTGLQIGLANFCVDMNGVQIGVFNYIEQGRFKYLPLVNAKF